MRCTTPGARASGLALPPHGRENGEAAEDAGGLGGRAVYRGGARLLTRQSDDHAALRPRARGPVRRRIEPLLEVLEAAPNRGQLLVRMGGYVVGVFQGVAVASKVGRDSSRAATRRAGPRPVPRRCGEKERELMPPPRSGEGSGRRQVGHVALGGDRPRWGVLVAARSGVAAAAVSALLRRRRAAVARARGAAHQPTPRR